MTKIYLAIAIVLGLILSIIPYQIYVGTVKHNSLFSVEYRKGVGILFGYSISLTSKGYPPNPVETLYLDVLTYPFIYLGEMSQTLLISVRILTFILNTIAVLGVTWLVLYYVKSPSKK